MDKADRVKESDMVTGWDTAGEVDMADVAIDRPVLTEQV